MKNSILFSLLIFTVLLTFTFRLSAANYYVSTSGSDSNSGTKSLPFKTIQKGVNKVFGGDTLFVAEGTYSEMVTFLFSGSANKYIVFKASGVVTVEDPCPNSGACGVWTWGGIFNLDKKNYIIIDGFKLQNSWFFGIYATACNHVIFKNNHTYNTGGSGIYVDNSTEVKILNNRVEKACSMTPKTLVIGSQESISVAVTTDFEVAHNEVAFSGVSEGDAPTAQGGEGIDAKAGCQNGSIHDNLVHDLYRLGIYLDAWDSFDKNISVYNNSVWNCREGIVVATESGGTIDSVQIYNNLCFKNEQSGISIVDYGAIDGPKKNITIMNNTCYKNGYQIYSNGTTGGGITIGSSLISNVIIRNNIVSNNNRWQIFSVATFEKDHNLIDGYRAAYQEIKPGASDVTGDPKFTNPEGNDFTLLASSLAIDKAHPTIYATNDFAGITRPQGLLADIGAFEYVDSTVTGIVEFKTNNTFSVYPTPFTQSFTLTISPETKFKNAKMKIYDVCGKEVKTIPISNFETTVERGDLKSGIYFYIIVSNNKIIGNGKLVVQ